LCDDGNEYKWFALIHSTDSLIVSDNRTIIYRFKESFVKSHKVFALKGINSWNVQTKQHALATHWTCGVFGVGSADGGKHVHGAQIQLCFCFASYP